MTAELSAQIEPVSGAAALRDGWRGLIDFGETWSESDTDLVFPPGSRVRVGEPLVYGCEVVFTDAVGVRVVVRFIALDRLRPVMVSGTRFTLRDGATAQAIGHIT